MLKLKGRLKYMGWDHKPWVLEKEDGDVVDLWPAVHLFFNLLNGKHAGHKEEISTEVLHYRLYADETSDFKFEYIPGELVFLTKVKGGMGASNVHAYLDRNLIWLSGRLVEVEISDTEMKFTPDTSEEVHGVHFSEGGICEVSTDIAETVCKLGQEKNTCVFLAFGGNASCLKFSPTARMILDRLAAGTMVSGRIGSCKIVARKKESSVVG